jgi:hypothetical protein
MDETRIFQYLASQDAAVLLDRLRKAYAEMSYDQRQAVFGDIVLSLPPVYVDGEDLLDEIEEFRRESLAGVYYAPFRINSKNWMHVPEETKEWFEFLRDFLQASAQLTTQGEHHHAVACFGILYELIERMVNGEEIVFGDEIGTWMIPGDEKQAIAAYLTSLAAVASPEEFAAAALPLVKRDSWESFSNQVYATAMQVTDEAQRACLAAEIARMKVRTGP